MVSLSWRAWVFLIYILRWYSLCLAVLVHVAIVFGVNSLDGGVQCWNNVRNFQDDKFCTECNRYCRNLRKSGKTGRMLSYLAACCLVLVAVQLQDKFEE